MPKRQRPLLEPEEFEELKQRRNVNELLEVLAEFVKASPGRHRVYDSEADRQRAYRIRRKGK